MTQDGHTRHSSASARFVTFAGTVGLVGAWQWLIVQQQPVSAVVLGAVSGLVVGPVDTSSGVSGQLRASERTGGLLVGSLVIRGL